MLWTAAVVLLVLWVLGLATSYTIGGLIHILLVLAVISVAFQLIQGRRVVGTLEKAPSRRDEVSPEGRGSGFVTTPRASRPPG